MKQIFDWLREQIQSKANLYRECPSESCWIRTSKDCDRCELKSLEVREIFEVINEAEAKWGCHAICYLDSPCEYQNEDINVTKADEYYKKTRAMAIDEFAEKFIYKVHCEGCSGCTNCYETGTQDNCDTYRYYAEVAEQLKGE